MYRPPPFRPRARRSLAGLLSAAPTAVLEQASFRWRADDGSESAASWLGAQDANLSGAIGVNRRLRLLINASGDPASKPFELQYRYNGGSWKKVKVRL